MARDHSPRIVNDGLIFYVDSINTRSYPGSGTTWTDMVGRKSGTLTNGPTFNSGGYINFNAMRKKFRL